MIIRTDSYYEACKICYSAILADLHKKNIKINNIAEQEDYPVSRRTVYNFKDIVENKKDEKRISTETFAKIADYFDLKFEVSFLCCRQSNTKAYLDLDKLPVDVTADVIVV